MVSNNEINHIYYSGGSNALPVHQYISQLLSFWHYIKKLKSVLVQKSMNIIMNIIAYH